jgi:hypothetical protein
MERKAKDALIEALVILEVDRSKITPLMFQRAANRIHRFGVETSVEAKELAVNHLLRSWERKFNWL